MRASIIILVGCALAAVTAGPAIGAEARRFRVGFAQDTLSNDWRMAQARGLAEGFAGHPEIEFFHTDAGGDTARQIQDISDMIRQKVDVLITSPRDTALMAPVVSRAHRAGIPVVLISRRVEGDDYTTFIHPDNERIAENAARHMARKMDGRGRILMLQHIPTTTPAIQRTRGFIEGLRPWPDMKVVDIRVANSQRSEAILMVEGALREGLSFNAIYAQSDSMASGARFALEKAGLSPADFVIVGIDYIREAREAILAGAQSASFTYPTGAAEAVAVTLRLIEGRPVEKEIIIPSVMVTRENAGAIAPIF